MSSEGVRDASMNQSSPVKYGDSTPTLRAFYRYIGEVKEMVADTGSSDVNIDEIFRVFRDTYEGK